MSTDAADPPPLEIWGGVECTINRVGDRWFDQMAWSGHDCRPDDLARIAALGIRAIRYPALWERLAPESLDHIDWRWTDERLACLRDLGLRPILGLVHHGSGPSYTSLLDSAFPEKLARFAGAVARRYPWVADFTPVNEPLTTARFSGLYGHWYPHGRTDREFVRALLNQARGVVLAMRAIREVAPAARLVQTEDCGRTFGTAVMRRQVSYEGHRRWLTWDLLMGRVDDRHPLHGFLWRSGMTAEEEQFFQQAECRPDILGLNYYLTSDRYLDHRVHGHAPATHGGNGEITYADVEAVRARPEGIAGHETHLLDAWTRYRIPVAITEVHLGCTRDEQMRWLVESWRGAHAARARGADVRAVCAWALLGSFNWDSLVTCDAGHYEPGAFDVRARAPRRTAVAFTVASLAAGHEPSHPALAGPGWWRRPERMVNAGARRTPPANGQPLLIVGRTGTLGSAFYRICEHRGLAFRVVGRPEVDITDSSSVHSLVRHVQPWAVINAAGYVRVDDAERDAEACRRSNVAGAVNLAATCRRHGVPLVTFSSDLVFDGHQRRPYTESDETRPLNVYGTTKAEAERRVLELLPDALVIRTSAFFGPWDDYNFLAAVFRALDGGTQFQAAADSVVSPTYVPDLVHATLDLLIDGEHGLWHLANDGAVTWFEFARAAAERSDRQADLIAPVQTSQACGPAVRPLYSALSSCRGRLLRPLDEALGAFLHEMPAWRVAMGTDGCVSR
jgi:dTDP-4-dehydrorhamnose reductase